MLFQFDGSFKGGGALPASEAGMNPLVLLQKGVGVKIGGTLPTFVGFHAKMNVHMLFHLFVIFESDFTFSAGIDSVAPVQL